MLKTTKNKLNSFKTTPFIALLSYDTPDLDIVCSPDETAKFGLKFRLDAKNSVPLKYDLQKFPISFDEYKRRFDIVQEHQKNGDSYLLNLCFSTVIKTDLGLQEIFEHSNAKVAVLKEGDFVCFSPEPFVRIENSYIHTFPMKGTIDASLPNAGEILLNDEKELGEQAMVVDLMRNDLSMVASEVRVHKFRFIERAAGLLQTSSHISGKLHEDLGFGDIFDKILPAGSISGTPKHETCRIINECECEPRGFYTGVFVYFDGEILQSFVMIRFVKKLGQTLKFFSGGGITARSDARKEYDELLQKVGFTF
ncbi:aminodeoxychorismate synthase component I [Campylobacter curvus]|uniref:aminodeoxychorismate synthase component I n=1 Tax=Campylobacter curvus TaxID=200 RepID=UPI0014706264|nr:aminodeoxychorismate synthase component I [Campylobacter curvus]